MATPTYLKPEFSDLESCVGIAHDLLRNCGGSASHDEFSKIVGNTVTSSYFLLKVNTLRAYGFFEQRGKTVRLTPAGQHAAAPPDQEEYRNALQTAMAAFPIFKSLTERYLGKGEPESQYVANALMREGTIKTEKAQAWATCFLKSGRFAEIFGRRSVPTAAILGAIPSNDVGPSFRIEPSESQISHLSESEVRQEWLIYPVPVEGGVARIVVPPTLSRSAWEKLKRLLEAIEPDKTQG